MNRSNSASFVRAALLLGLISASHSEAGGISSGDSAQRVFDSTRKAGEPARRTADSVVRQARWDRLDAVHPHGIFGVVDSLHAVSMEDIIKMGLDSARKLYVGKIVTFKGLTPVGVRAKNEERKNVCMQGFVQSLPKKTYYIPGHRMSCHSGGLDVYFNFGDEISGWMTHTPYEPKNLKLTKPLTIPLDVCDTTTVCNEWNNDSGNRRCLFSSQKLLIAGKVVAVEIDESGVDFGFVVRPTGVRY